MRIVSLVALAALVLGSLVAAPVAADPGRGGKGHHARQHHHHHDHRRGADRHHPRAHCPPGLARKGRACLPPGQARKQQHSRQHAAHHHGPRVGHILDRGDYRLIRDPRRYDLEQRRGWSYFQDRDRIYRVDSETRRILAVMNLIQAFTQ